MSATNRLINQDPTLVRHNEGHWDQPFNPNLPGFSSFNDAGVECETGEYLYALTRLLKPEHVLETGTHHAVGSSYIGLGLQDNGAGKLDTVEFLPEIWTRAKQRIADLNLTPFVTCHLCDAATFNAPYTYQLILLDTEPQTRYAEAVRFSDGLDEGGIMLIHDLHRHMHQIPNAEHGFAWPYGPIPEALKQLVAMDILRPFHFSTPRGLTGFYKPSKDDYKWGQV